MDRARVLCLVAMIVHAELIANAPMTGPHDPYPEIESEAFILDGEQPVYRVLRLIWSAPAGSVLTTPARPWHKPGTKAFLEGDKQ